VTTHVSQYDSGGPPTARTSAIVAAIATLLMSLASAGIVAWYMLVRVPTVEALFRDFKVSLPDSTKLVLIASRHAREHLAIYAFVPFALAAGVGWVVYRLGRRAPHPWLPAVYAGIVCMLELFLLTVFVGWMNSVMQEPFFELMRAVSGPRK
jgi:hypothetical protein